MIRHGQASFGADDYDALSDAGHEQARVLGRSLAARGIRPGLVLRGTLRRHAETAAGLDLPAQVTIDPGWDETRTRSCTTSPSVRPWTSGTRRTLSSPPA